MNTAPPPASPPLFTLLSHSLGQSCPLSPTTWPTSIPWKICPTSIRPILCSTFLFPFLYFCLPSNRRFLSFCLCLLTPWPWCCPLNLSFANFLSPVSHPCFVPGILPLPEGRGGRKRRKGGREGPFWAQARGASRFPALFSVPSLRPVLGQTAGACLSKEKTHLQRAGCDPSQL